jgi:hypothetical protein
MRPFGKPFSEVAEVPGWEDYGFRNRMIGIERVIAWHSPRRRA